MFNDQTASSPDFVPLSRPPGDSPRERILVAEDDANLRPVLVEFLTSHGYRVLAADDGRRALEIALREQPLLAILDVEMPGLGGLAVLSRLREAGSNVAILILSSQGEVKHRIAGLTLGADDYLPKPFDFEELLARVRALIRRQAPPAATRRLHLGSIVIDFERMVAQVNGEAVRLSRTECSILDLLAKNGGRPVTRARLLDVVWGYTYLPNTRTLDTHIWRLRKKLGDTGDQPRWLINVPGVGYQLDLTPFAGAV